MSNPEVQTAKKPNARFKVVLADGKEQEVFMSAGLLRHLTAMFDNVGQVATAFMNPTLQNDLMYEALRPRDQRGLPMPRGTGEELEMDVEQGTQFTTWLLEHVFDFFTTQADTLRGNLGQTHKALMSLMVSQNGSKDLQQQKPSAGSTNVA